MAIVMGLVAAYVVKQALHRPIAQRPAPPAPEKVPVVFARYNIPKNARLTANDIVVSYVAKETKAAQGTFRGATQTEGRISKDIIRAGQAIREDYLLPLGEALPDLAERLPAGHRAVTIIIEGADTGGKRLAEGDHIDIAMTVEGTHPDLGEVMTRTIMRNVLVVDAAQSRPTVRGTRRNNIPDNSSITVAVPPAEANKLIVAQRTGTLQATLVSSQDTPAAKSEEDAVSRRQLLGLKEIKPARKYTIEKWTGSSVKILEMSDDRIRESREVSGNRRETPVTKTDATQEPNLNAPSGVKVPDFTFVSEEAPAAIPSAIAEVK
jgi:pilus assembly protein CpaB